MKTIILASQSPRRAEFLKTENYFFVSFPVYVSEIPDKNLSLNDQIIDIASRKAQACLAQYPDKKSDHLILASDTMVCIDGLALGKPESQRGAVEMLKLLSGRQHEVKTAIVLIEVATGKIRSHIETTIVHFKILDDDRILDYVATGEPKDKAGAYGIQGAARDFIARVDGDYDNVVGLPVRAMKKMFTENQWTIKNAH